MNSQQEFTLPTETFRLDEINLPRKLAISLAGKVISVEVIPEQEARTLRVDPANLPDGLPLLVDPKGVPWNDYWPTRVSFVDSGGTRRRIPRHWLTQGATPLKEEDSYEVTREIVWAERLHLPSWWDLCDINIDPDKTWEAGGKPTQVEVCARPGRQVEVRWKDSAGTAWRIPHDWRRRRVRLPSREVLVEYGVPPEVAEEYGSRAVSVNYHPGSLCCLPDG
jgi:hypothetical protein